MKLTADKLSLKQHLKDKKYDVVVDGSDNVATRYLLNDFCVLNGIPLVSGSALQFEGQLTVYNYENGPCYRCLFPVPPPPEAVTNCGDGGVLGPSKINTSNLYCTMMVLSSLFSSRHNWCFTSS